MGVLYFLTVIKPQADHIGPIYSSMIELLSAYYYVALAFVFKSLKEKLKITLEFDEVAILLGPLGFFGLLLALPIALAIFGGTFQ